MSTDSHRSLTPAEVELSMTESASEPTDPAADLSASLLGLGFTSYEARCYIGLLGAAPQTGYGVAKRTGVPQPKVYEALRKLVRRGAAQQLDGEPTTFVATPAETLLQRLRVSFSELHDRASSAAAALEADRPQPTVEPVFNLGTWEEVLATALRVITGAQRRAYVSASPDEMSSVLPALRERVDAGVDVVLLDFGRTPLSEQNMRIFRHASTENAIYRHHRARHFALVVDSTETVNALAVDGTTWNGIHSTSSVIIAAVKGMIKHDIDLQQIYADFGPQLVEAYGPGLQALELYRRDQLSRAETSAGEQGPGLDREAL